MRKLTFGIFIIRSVNISFSNAQTWSWARRQVYAFINAHACAWPRKVSVNTRWGSAVYALQLENSAGNAAGSYTFVGTNGCGTIPGNPAVLTINPIPDVPGVTVNNDCGSSVLTATGLAEIRS